MKLFIGLFRQEYAGLPVSPIDAVQVENIEGKDVFETINNSLVKLLDANVAVLDTPDLVGSLTSSGGIKNAINLREVDVYLNEHGSKLIVGVQSDDQSIPQVDDDENVVYALVPTVYPIPVLITLVLGPEESAEGIGAEVVSKFNIGSGLTPINNLNNLVTALGDMRERGLPIPAYYGDAIVNELSKYNVELYFQS